MNIKLKNNKKICYFLITILICLLFIGVFKILNQETNLKNEKLQLIKSEVITEKKVSTKTFLAQIKVLDYIINSILIDDVYYLFVPQNVDISDLIINYNIEVKSTTNGEINKIEKTIINNFTENNEIILNSEDNINYKLKVMQSDVPSICINSDNVTLEEINGGTKDIKYKANLQVIGANQEKYNISNKTIELKGRGNSTWLYEKKPYQIKFEEEEELLGINGKAKKWILLANYLDKSLLKSNLSFDLQKQIGLSDSINGTFVDLYINGEFLGNYTLCDKIDIGKSRVNLTDANGVIAELDNAYDEVEPNKFKTKISEASFVIKESVSKEGSEEYLKRF